MPGECGVDQGQSADAPEIHQQDENALRQDSQLRRQPQRQAHRTGGGRCFIETGTEGKLLRCADDRRPRKGQPQIQQQNGGGVADSGCLQSAVEELQILSPAEGGDGVGNENCQRRDLHAARRGAGCSAGEHQQNGDRLRGIRHLRQIHCVIAGRPRRDRLKKGGQYPLSYGEVRKICQIKEKRRNRDQKRRRAQNDLALHPVTPQVQTVRTDIVPR